MLLQITYQDKTTLTEKDNTIEDILKAITTLCIKVDSMDNEIQKLKTNEDNLKSKASTSHQHNYKNAELSQSEDFKNPELRSTSKQVSEKQHKNATLNQLFEKPFTPRTSRNTLTMEPQTSTYADSLQNEKNLYNHVTRTYIENIYKIQTYLNRNPRSTTTKEPSQDYLTQKLQGYKKYWITRRNTKIEIPSFYANKRIIGISTIIQELANNYLTGNAIWSYYSRDQLMIYSNSRELRKTALDEIQRWILSLLKPQERPTTRALRAEFISSELLTRYCKLIGHKYPDHTCSKCNGEDNIIPDVQLE
ncbi:hypothetical protein H5410_002811 [Solanum commersonii]|uniref:Uncharacterized protein n=1 Tax=Solanum commersonii TaxID=4109 RepID=A0A9J6B2Y8_SOLCO|nr:hypothetical protein H5410_002811 [Solanum commersonii]